MLCIISGVLQVPVASVIHVGVVGASAGDDEQNVGVVVDVVVGVVGMMVGIVVGIPIAVTQLQQCVLPEMGLSLCSDELLIVHLDI